MSTTTTTTTTNPAKAITKRLLTENVDLHSEAVWMLKREFHLLPDDEFHKLLCTLKGMLKSKTLTRLEPELLLVRFERFAQCVLDATDFPLTRWIGKHGPR